MTPDQINEFLKLCGQLGPLGTLIGIGIIGYVGWYKLVKPLRNGGLSEHCAKQLAFCQTKFDAINTKLDFNRQLFEQRLGQGEREFAAIKSELKDIKDHQEVIGKNVAVLIENANHQPPRQP